VAINLAACRPYFPLDPRSTTQFDCTDTEQPSFPTPSAIVIHGPPATGKSVVTKAVLDISGVHHAIVSSRECITVRHLLEEAATRCWLAMRDINSAHQGVPLQPRCDSVNSLCSSLEKLLLHVKKFILVFDGIDRQREATPILLPGLARLGSVVRMKLYGI
jgi:origin recognition complex subunit 5